MPHPQEKKDTSDFVIWPDLPALDFTEEQLAKMTRNHENSVISYVPGFRYWACGEGRKMNQSDNFCGHQQRAFEFYWALRALQDCAPAVSVGAGAIGAPNTITTDKYNGRPPENDGGRYGAGYGFSCMEMDADEVWPFHDKQFGAVFFNHSFEHLRDQSSALAEALRVLKTDGWVCIIMPDMTYSGRGCIDPTHTREWSGDEFLAWLREGNSEWAPFVVETHNTLDNAFSFDTVLRRVG